MYYLQNSMVMTIYTVVKFCFIHVLVCIMTYFFACLSLFRNNKKNQFTVLMMQETFITTTIMPLFKMSFNLFYLVLKENNYMKIKYLANPYVQLSNNSTSYVCQVPRNRIKIALNCNFKDYTSIQHL